MHPPNSRFLPWLRPRSHGLNGLFALGYHTIQVAMNHASCQWGSGPVNHGQYNRLIPQRFLWSDLGNRSCLPMAPLLHANLALPLFGRSMFPDPMMTPQDLVRWWAAQMRPHPAFSAGLSGAVRAPSQLVKLGYTLMRSHYYDVSDHSPEIGCCLSMVGVGALATLGSAPCKVCMFRRAVFGTLRCGVCSRSKQVIEPHEQRRQAARAMKARRIRATGVGLREIHPTDLQASFTRSFAAMLFRMRQHSTAHHTWLSEIDSALRDSPSISAALPANFMDLGPRVQLGELQNCIDSNEWDYSVWSAKIRLVQKWNDASALVQSRRRGPGPMPRTIKKANTAMELLASGMSKTEVAHMLGISLSHLCHLLRRTADCGR